LVLRPARADLRPQARVRNYSAGELEPGAVAAAGDVHHPQDWSVRELEQRTGQMSGEGGGTDLVRYHRQLLAFARLAQDRLRKAPPTYSEQP
jgi:hypothetical protein